MRIKQKLVTSFVAISLLVSIVGVIGLYANNQIVTSFEAGEEHFDSIIKAANEVTSYAKRAEGHAALFIMFQSTDDRDKALERVESLKEQATILDARIKNPDARKISDNITARTEKLDILVQSLIIKYDSDMETTGEFKIEDVDQIMHDIHDVSSALRRDGLELTKLELELKNEHNIEAKQKASSLFNIVFIISGFAVFSAIAIGTIVDRDISKPISKLRDSAIDIGKGNLGTIIDITSNDEIGELADTFNQMAHNLRKSNAEIISAKDYTDNIVHSMKDSLIVTTLEGVIQTVNTATTILLGYSKDELIGNNIDMMQLGGNESQFDELKKNISKNGSIKNIETMYKSKRLREIPVLLSASIMYGKHDEIQGIVYVAKDLIDRKLNEELERMNDLFVGRELKVIELKERIAELEKDIEKYKT